MKTIERKQIQVPVIDRYNLVLQIFLQHAATREARLQVGLWLFAGANI